MKIDIDRANFDRVEHAKSPATEAAAGKGATPEAVAGGDTVRLSSNAQFATTAVNAAERSPEIRQDKIERAQALLADGSLGSDPLKLADALIDRAIAKE